MDVLKIVLAGATGFIGRAMRAAWHVDELVILSRDGEDGTIQWDGKSQGDWSRSIDGSDGVVNLAGAPITLKWTAENRRLIADSRVNSTRAIAEAILAAQRPPRIWVNGSAVGYYGDRGDDILTELSRPGQGFLPETCVAWEAAAELPVGHPTKVSRIRTGIVLGRGGGALEPLRKLASLFLGGAAGSGRQWMPWIHVEDHVRLMRWCLEGSFHGPINAVAPNPVPNHEFMHELRRQLRRPWAPPTPSFALHIIGAVGGPNPDLLLDSQRAVPEKALANGFEFRFSELDEALSSLV